MNKITFILPLDEFNENIQMYLESGLKSIKLMCPEAGSALLRIVGNKEAIEKAKELALKHKFGEKAVKTIEDNGDFVSHINTAALSCTTKYFSVFQFEDEYFKNWAKNALEYNENDEFPVVLPLDMLVSGENTGLGNEIALSAGFSDVPGILGQKELETYFDFTLFGGFIKTDVFASVGGLKPSLKFAAFPEFLLRTAFYGNRIRVVPKLGYKRNLNVEGGYFTKIFKEVEKEEGKKLVEAAKKEYFFKEDRGVE